MLKPAPSFRLRGAPSASWTARTPDSTGRLVGASFYHGHLVGGPYLENMNRSLWLQCNESRLVELHSSRRVEVRTSSDGSLGVWLCGDGPDVLLFEGPESGATWLDWRRSWRRARRRRSFATDGDLQRPDRREEYCSFTPRVRDA